MSQYLSMIPSQQMRLEQRLSPQLVQSMEILQLPLLALEARVREELEMNPVLEEPETEPSSRKEDVHEEPPTSEKSQAEAESFERLERLGREYEFDPGDLPYSRGAGSADGERNAKMDAMANTASRGEGLRELMIRQWALIDCDPGIRAAGEAIIDWMDEDGYLRREVEHHAPGDNGDGVEITPLIIRRTDEERRRLLEEIALSRTPPLEIGAMESALCVVQTLEPIGVASRDLTECLLIQLAAKNETDPFYAELVSNHLSDLGKNQYPQVAKATGRSIEDIKAALLVIGKLNHHPGLLIQPNDVPRISPDILIDYSDDGDGYTVRLARGNTQRLRISAQYREMLQDKMLDKETRAFIKQRVESAGVLIDAIQYRRDRLLEIAKVLVDRQREFFDFGPQFMKVLRMRDLAEEFGCDPSTISRTVDGKYVQTPRGLFPVRQFFSGGTTDSSGEAVSWNSIKAKVKEIIDGEDKSNPLTDDEIMKLVNAQTTVPIARRTVAKYRSQLGIPSQRERKAY